MRVMILPSCGGAEGLLSYATVATSRVFIRDMVEQYPDAFFEWVLPKSDGVYWRYDEAELLKKLKMPRLNINFVRMLPSAINGIAVASMDMFELFNIQKTMKFYDCVLNNWLIFAPQLKKVLRAKFERMSIDVPVFNFPIVVHNEDRDRMTKYNYWGEEEFISDATGYLTDYAVFMIKDEFKMGMQTCRKYLSAAMCKRMAENSLVASMAGVDIEALDASMLDRKKPSEREDKRVCLFFGGRWVSQKGFDDVLLVMRSVRDKGLNVRCVCTTGQAKSDGEIKELEEKNPGVEFYHTQGREEFFKWISQGDIFICFATTELLGLAYWEMMYGGMVGVFKKSPFLEEMLPSEYPFIGGSESDITMKVCQAVKTIEDGRFDELLTGMLEKTKDKIRDILGSKKMNKTIYDWMEMKTEEHMTGKHRVAHGSMLELAKTACDSLEAPFSFTQACEAMTKFSRGGREFGRKGDMIGRFYVRRLFLDAGYRDLCNDAEPYFVKK